MIERCVFLRPKDLKEEIARRFNLESIVANAETEIFQNDDMRFFVQKDIVYVTFFKRENENLIENVKGYFYGEEYDRA